MKIRLLILLILFTTPGWSQVTTLAVISDSHYGASGAREKTLETIRDLNQLGTDRFHPLWPILTGRIAGLIHCGDLLNDPDPAAWQDFLEDFGLSGEKQVPWPVYEMFGNHDGGINDPVRQGMLDRNPQRVGLSRISDNGLHYSWDYPDLHCIALNAYPGNAWDDTCGWCHYFKDDFRFPEYSLVFLKKDLAALPRPDMPVLIFQHYGWDDFSRLWWTDAEREAFYEVIRGYRVLGIFHGHNHAVEQRSWHGIPVYASGSSQKESEPGDVLILRVRKDRLRVFHRKGDRWLRITKVN